MLLLAALLSACEKEIEIDYRSVEPVYVVEALVNQEYACVKLTHTVDMDQPADSVGLPGATVTLLGSDGSYTPFSFCEDALYRPYTPFEAQIGVEYTLTVEIAENVFTSSSTLLPPVPIISNDFVSLDMLGFSMIFYEFEIEADTDDGQIDYFCYHMYRNGEEYRWDVFTDKGYTDGVVLHDIMCVDRKTLDKDDPDDADRILYDGDTITLDVWHIDRATYEYLNSLGSSSANPVSAFSGGCLGYFAAYGLSTAQSVYHPLPD